MATAAAVRITSFGEGRFEYPVPGGAATVGEALQGVGVRTRGRRVALNGHPAGADTAIREGDELTIVPRVQRG